ncbi:hypothetical protein QFZ35_001234 [Arthrobacter ulcerisalmonis]|nr:hypothetical protein [Arthrobacter ulcerisalmonis]
MGLKALTPLATGQAAIPPRMALPTARIKRKPMD